MPGNSGDTIIGKKINAIPTPQKEIGIDLNNTLFNNIILATQEAGNLASAINISDISEMDTKSINREQRFQLLDTMLQDSTISAVVETYTEDTTEYNDQGRIMWVESSNSDVSNFVDFLLKSLKVDKNIYKWANCLIKYGDVYLRLYRKSEYQDKLFDELNLESQFEGTTQDKNDKSDKREIYYDDLDSQDEKKAKPLNESVYLRYYKDNDKFVPYLEMIPNPAEVFELTRFGKTAGYIKTNIPTAQYNATALNNQYMTYKFDRGDVELFGAKEFVHACLEDASNRCPESVEIFVDRDYKNRDKDRDGTSSKSSVKSSYDVRGGVSMLASAYKAWRELMLLQQSVMLNRVTQSSVIRVIGVEVGDMPKEMIGPHIRGIKNMIEQKAAIMTGNNMSEYTNPGPTINTIYIPKHEGVGDINIQSIGGDVDVKGLADLDYFMNQMFGALRVPKQFFCLRGDTNILLLNGHKVTIKEMFDHKEDYIGKGIMGCKEDGTLDPTTIKNIMLTNPSTDFIRIYLDNGEFVDVTENHRMMLRDGKFEEAKNIKIGDSLMPYYDSIRGGRRFVLDNKLGKFLPQYRVDAESVQEVPIVQKIDEYVPECNHKVVNIEHIDVEEPAFDIEVTSDSHTFALPCGIFVHNCQTDDAAGFSGGESLALISSRYAKSVKRIQNALIQMVTDAINILLIDRGLPNYVNKFKLKMQQPTTKEEKERKEMVETKVRFVESVNGLLSDVDDQILKLKITKTLLSDAIQNNEVITLLQDQIDQLEHDAKEEVTSDGEEITDGLSEEENSMPLDLGSDLGGVEPISGEEERSEPYEAPDNGELPTPSDLGIDFTDNSQS